MRALAIVPVIAGCGLAPAPATEPPPAGGGNAPWADVGNPSVCLGELALDAPTATVGAFCLSPLTPATHACAVDGDCRTREACVCGKCVVAYCGSQSDCPDGWTCDFTDHRCDHACTADTDCALDEQCLAGACRGRCGTSEDCQHGEVCDRNHVCITDDCVDASGCLAGETCEPQRQPVQMLEPAPLAVGDAVELYFDLATPATPDDRSIWRATSTDGRHFVVDPATPVIAHAHAPSPIVLGDRVVMYFVQDGAIRAAESTDHVTFGAIAEVVPAPIAPATIDSPGAVALGDAIAVYYAASDGTLGLAVGTAATPTAAFVDRGTVLTPADVTVGDPTIADSAFWNPVVRLASPSAVAAGPDGAGIGAGATVHLYFSGFGQESGPATKHDQPLVIPPNYSIGFAAAPIADPGALSPWPYGPVADDVAVFTEHHDELGPGVVRRTAGWRMYYIDATRGVGVGLDGPYALGRLVVRGSGR